MIQRRKQQSFVEEDFARHKPSQYFAAVLDNKTVSHARAMHIQESITRPLNAPLRNASVKAFSGKATGVKGGKRLYSEIAAAIEVQTANGGFHNPPIQNLLSLQTKITTENLSFKRIVYALKESAQEQPYVVALRAIQTSDFLTANVTEISQATLNETAGKILKGCRNVSAVCYDVTPNPQATVEME